MTATLRDTLLYDSTFVVTDAYSIPLPGDLVANDWGVVVVSWASADGSAPGTTLTSTDWTQTVAPTTVGGIGFAVLTRKFQTSDTAVNFTLGTPYATQVTGAWYSGVDRIDATGPQGSYTGVFTNTLTAPGVTTSAITGDMILSVFVNSLRSTFPSSTVSEGTIIARQDGQANTVSTFISAHQQSAIGTGDPVICTLSSSVSPAWLTIQVGLFPTGATRGYVVNFAPTVSLTVTDVVVSAPVTFTPEISLATTGVVIGPATFGPQVALSARGVVKTVAAFRPHVILTTIGRIAKTAHPKFKAAVAFKATGRPTPHAAVALGPHVTLTAVGVRHATATVHFGPHVALTATGEAYKRNLANFGPRITLTVTGKPIPHQTIRLRPHVQFGVITRHPLLHGAAAFGPKVKLTTRETKVITSSHAAFHPHVAFTCVGIPDFTPVAVATFHPRVVFTADGFQPEVPPIGITIKPVINEPDPVWHEPGPVQTWEVAL